MMLNDDTNANSADVDILLLSTRESRALTLLVGKRRTTRTLRLRELRSVLMIVMTTMVMITVMILMRTVRMTLT